MGRRVEHEEGDLLARGLRGDEVGVAGTQGAAGGKDGREGDEQGQYEPMSVAKQVMQIYTGTNRDDPGRRGWLREIPVSDVVRYSKEFLAFCDAKFPAIEKRIEADKKLPEVNKAASDAELNKAITEFNAAFVKTPGAKL